MKKRILHYYTLQTDKGAIVGRIFTSNLPARPRSFELVDDINDIKAVMYCIYKNALHWKKVLLNEFNLKVKIVKI